MKRRTPRVGDTVEWSVGRGKHKRTFRGKVFKTNPSIAPGARYGIRHRSGETYYPLAKVKRVDGRRR